MKVKHFAAELGGETAVVSKTASDCPLGDQRNEEIARLDLGGFSIKSGRVNAVRAIAKPSRLRKIERVIQETLHGHEATRLHELDELSKLLRRESFNIGILVDIDFVPKSKRRSVERRGPEIVERIIVRQVFARADLLSKYPRARPSLIVPEANPLQAHVFSR